MAQSLLARSQGMAGPRRCHTAPRARSLAEPGVPASATRLTRRCQHAAYSQARSSLAVDAQGAPAAAIAAAALAASLMAANAALAAPEQATEQVPPPLALEQPASVPAEPVTLGGLLSAISELSDAPELVTDMDVEAALSPTAASVESALVTGLEWMVEEVTESSFTAVGAPTSSMWLSNSPWCLVWDAYCNVLTSRPVATKLATGMVGTFLGDLLAQATQVLVSSTSHAVCTVRGQCRAGSGTSSAAHASSGSSSSGSGAPRGFALDLARTARLVGFSALVGTPVAFVWFSLLDQYVLPADPTSPLAVFSKVALDQVLMAPCMTSLFFTAMAFLEGRRGAQIGDTVSSKLRPTLLANWTVWPLAHVINFGLVPPAQRILYINVVNIAWTAFMSHMASQSGQQQQQQQQQPAGPPARAGATTPKQLQQAGR